MVESQATDRPAGGGAPRGGAGASGYRPEIDGLRAIAVIAVILNHFNHNILPSGYLGVDIFFVISGYVITASLARQRHDSFRDFLLGFYARRVQRLAPALLVFVLITSMLFPLVNPDPGVALGTGRRALLGMANIEFYRSATDYFAASSALNPFTHTWSLGVEEQFYLVFPLLVWLSGLGRAGHGGSRLLFGAMLVLSLASLVGFVALYSAHQPAAYFLMPWRLWELGSGSLLFVALRRPEGPLRSLRLSPPLLPGVALLAVLFLPLAWAVPATILVVLLTSWLLACLRPGSRCHGWLTGRQMVGVGLLSYSLYLWHWGVLCLSRWTIGIHWWSWPFQAALIAGLAIGSYRWVERPLRQRAWSPSRAITIAWGLAATTAALLGSIALRGAARNNGLYLGDRDRIRENQREVVPGTTIRSGTCSWWMGEGPELEKARRICTTAGRASAGGRRRRFFVLGDSHAGNLSGWMADMRKVDDTVVRMLYVYSQPVPLLPRRLDAAQQADLARQDQLIRQTLAELRQGDTVILSNYLLGYFGSSHNGREGLSSAESRERRRTWLEKLATLTRASGRVGATVVVIGPLPDFSGQVMPADQDFQICSKEWFRPFPPAGCRQEISREAVLQEARPIVKGIQALQRRFDNLHLYDPLPIACNADTGICSNHCGDTRLFFDQQHLNHFGAQKLGSHFLAFLRQQRLINSAATATGR